MDFPVLPAESEYTLFAHREPAAEEGGPLGDPLPGAPRFVFRPLDPRERAKTYARLRSLDSDDDSLGYCDLFEERLLRIEVATFGGEAFDREKHMPSIDLAWQIEVGLHILTFSNLTKADQGK